MKSIIKQLDSVTINKIAAGEVVDRPASIVKELCENALDAGATKITVDVEDGGKRRIRITDNGHGFHKDDLPLAPLKHTTSKITALEDIYQASSFGFRGEALSSVCHCAHVRITSKQDHASAYSIDIHQDSIGPVAHATHANGSTIDVRDLFQNIPVRQRFLKTAATEFSYIYEVCSQLALIHPEIDFVLLADGQEKLNTTGISSLFDVIFVLYGRPVQEACVAVEQNIGPTAFSGYISNPTLTFSNRNKQVIAVNGRLIKNPLLLKSLQQSYKDIIPARRFPLAVLNIKTERSQLDVNIHPQKQDIKFLNPGFVFDCLPKAIYQSLQSSTMHTAPVETLIAPSLPQAPSTPTAQPTLLRPYEINKKTPPPQTEHHAVQQQLNTPLTPAPPELDFLQILNTYIILKTSQGAYMIDQHAVHERILYERIKSNNNVHAARQVLLLSEVISLTPDLMAIYNEEADFFASLNFIIEPFGSNEIAIREIPMVFQNANIHDLILDVLEQLKAHPGSSRDITLDQKETLQRQACRAAIKAGQCLEESEIRSLLADFIESPQNYTCPHGRPLFIYFDQSKLESLFMRK